MNEERKISEVIADFVKFLNNAQFSYTYMLEKMGEQDKITQDILHQLELEDLKYNERAKLATHLAAARKHRRIFKDSVEELEPIAEFLEENKKLLNNFGALVGAVRKQEKYHSNRQVLSENYSEGELEYLVTLMNTGGMFYAINEENRFNPEVQI